VQAFQTYYPGIGFGQTGSILGRDGTRQALIPVIAANTPAGWITEVKLLDQAGAVLVSASPQAQQGGTWLVALPGVNLVHAVSAEVILRPAQAGSTAPAIFRANISGLFDDLTGLFETGLLQDQGDILGQMLPSVRI
jgi:hypothetical protein